MKIFIASDHAAFIQKAALIREIKKDHQLVDLGTDSEASVHYPNFAEAVCKKVLEEKGSVGILLCGSGIGMSMAANRFKGIRAALCRSVEDAKLSREHNNANILCLGGRSTSAEDINAITRTWLSTPFEGGRHQIRTELMDNF
ncbi:MAG: ribose 5-phosphate isomerase B [Bacteriovoracaceae bacterium]